VTSHIQFALKTVSEDANVLKDKSNVKMESASHRKIVPLRFAPKTRFGLNVVLMVVKAVE
jgi:hypothetical protein